MVSRVSKNPVEVPQGVDVKHQGAMLTIKGKGGELEQTIHPLVKVNFEDNLLKVEPTNNSQEANALAGTMRALLSNMVVGVTEGFQRKLELRGVGYRAKASGKVLDLTLGFSHPVKVEMPEGVVVETPTQTEVVLKSANRQLVSQIAANIRNIRPPEPYKGKGVRYAGEHIALKEGKKK